MRDHPVNHLPYFLITGRELVVTLPGYVSTVVGEVDPDLSFRCFAITVSQFAHEHIRVLSFAVSFCDVRGHASGRTTDLAGK
jgi:hypothetical protein